MSISRSISLLRRLQFIPTLVKTSSRTKSCKAMAMSTSDGDVYVGTTERGLTQELQFPVPWGHIAAKAWGDPLGRPVLGLHGYLDNANTFDTLAPLLPKDLYFVSVDLTGHGRSSHLPPGISYAYENHVVDMHRVVLALGWKKFSLIAHSLGAGIAMTYSAVFPASVDRLTVLDLSGPIYYPLEGTVQRLVDAVKRKLEMEKTSELPPHVYSREEALQKLLKGNISKLTREAGSVLLERGAREVEGGVVFTRDLKLKSPGFFYRTPKQTEEMVKGIKCPVLMLRATESLASGYEQERAKRFVPLFEANSCQFTLIQVEGNHHVHLNHPERVAPHIRAFFTLDSTTQPQPDSKL
ncbi:serine hydrolase-like protein [Branchiostoma floridae x Branchiostoma japonicum]